MFIIFVKYVLSLQKYNSVEYSDHNLNTKPVYKWWSEYWTLDYQTLVCNSKGFII